MIDRRSFLGLMLGTAAAPKNVLSGLATPEPVARAWKTVTEILIPTGDGDVIAYRCTAIFTLAAGEPIKGGV